MENPDPVVGVKLKSKTHLLNKFFFIFWAVFGRLAVKLKKVLIWPSKYFIFEKLKKGIKNAEFHADFKSVGKVFKSALKKDYK